MHTLLRRLADIESDDLPVLSIYIDMRPQETGARPALRSGLVILKDRLREIEKTFPPRGDDLDSFKADAVRVERYLEEEWSLAAQGLAVFACSGRELFETVEAGVSFENQVSVGPAPDLYQLARLLDEQETALVAVVDTNTARIFATRAGIMEELGGPDDDPAQYGKRSMGGWSQARYQRHIDETRADFAREAAAEIELLVDSEGAGRVVLAGDQVAVPLLRNALSARVTAMVDDHTLRLDIKTPLDQVGDESEPLLARAEADDARSVADRLLDAVRGNGLGVAGPEATRRALENGQVDELLIDPVAVLDEDVRAEFVRQAVLTGARVEVVEDHTGFRRLGGVGALLRYRHG